MQSFKLHRLFFAVPLIVFISGCSTSASISTPTFTNTSISLTDGLGRQVDLANPAQRVVSLAPSSSEILFAIGAGEQAVGRDTFSDYPEAVKTVPDIGGGFGELNTEIILAQKPDLVLASSLTPPEQIKALEDLGITVYALANPSDFQGMFDSIRTVASLVGHEPQAEELIQGLQRRVSQVEEKVGSAPTRPLVFYELDGTDPNAPWTPGPGSYVDQLIKMAGGENLGNQLNSEWAQISIEELIAKDPDIILIGDATWGGVTLEDVRARSGWDSLQAIKSGNLYTFDDNLISRPGPRMVDGLQVLAKLLHPELFQ
jgi:iron complex transport system substrate-binding protein